MAAGSSSRSRPSRPATTATGTRCGSSRRDGADAPAPRQLTLGAEARPARPVLAGRPDARVPVGSPAGRRGGARRARKDVKEREDVDQVYLLPLDGGRGASADRPAARRRATSSGRRMARGWSSSAARVGATHEEDRRRRGTATQARARRAAAVRLPVHRPARLHAQRRRASPYDRVDAPVARRRRDRRGEPPDRRAGRASASRPGRRTARASPSRRTAAATTTSTFGQDIHVVDVATRRGDGRSPAARRPSSASRRGCPTAARSRRSATGSPAARAAATTSGCSRRTARTRGADGGRNLSRPARPDAGLGDEQRRDARRDARGSWPSPDGRSITFTRPDRRAPTSCGGSTVADGDVERLTDGRHYISRLGRGRRAPRGRPRIAYLRSTPTEPPDLWLPGRRGDAAPPDRVQRRRPRRARRSSSRSSAASTVDGRDDPGLVHPGAGEGRGRS